MQNTLNALQYRNCNTLQYCGLRLLPGSRKSYAPHWVYSCAIWCSMGQKGLLKRRSSPSPLGSHQHPQALFVQKEKCEQTATSCYSSRILTGSSQAFGHGTDTFFFKIAVQNERWRQSSSDLAAYVQLVGEWLSAYILSRVLVCWVFVYLPILPY